MHLHIPKAGGAIAALTAFFFLTLSTTIRAQNIDTAAIKAMVAGKKDTAKSKIKPYKEVVPATAKTSKGFFLIHKVDDRWLAEIPDSLLGRDILVVTRIVKGPTGYYNLLKALAGALSYAGDAINQSVIRFERLTDDKVFLRSVSYIEHSDDSSANGLHQNVQDNNVQPIEAAFPVKAVNEAGKSVVIDLTDFINSESEVLYFNAQLKPFLGLAGLAADRSFIQNIKAFPMNIEIKTVRTYNGAPGTGVHSYELNSSVVLLPSNPMRSRPADLRIGLFYDSYIDFDADPQAVRPGNHIWRWRMEPKPEDQERYLRGELVEPAKPIVIYIDPETPKKWVPYLIQGINDWQSAFEKAGFKNAIVGKEAPVGDSTWSMEDARHSVLLYHASPIENANGPSIKDPRTGEILETHINWFHNVMQLLYNWYFIQAAAVDPRARHPHFDDSLMGTLIRFVSSHEVGHTLGMQHNFGASSTVAVDSLRSKAWVDAHGHTPSIMDYARFDYVAQPEDGIDENGLFPHIGDYDKWTINWGYRWLPATISAEAEKDTLNAWIVRQLASGPQYFYGAQTNPFNPMGNPNNPDPRDQSEDLGDDAMKASEYGIRNLKRIEPHLMEWTMDRHDDYGKLEAMYSALVGQYARYMGHVLKNIGGEMITPKLPDQQGPVIAYPGKEKQQRAMAFLNTQLFTTPTWLIDEKLYSLGVGDFDHVAKIQTAVIDGLIEPSRIHQLLQQEEALGSKAYTVTGMLHDLQSGLFSELADGKPIDAHRRMIQKYYVNKLVVMLGADTSVRREVQSTSDGFTSIKTSAKALAASIKQAMPRYPAGVMHEHLTDLYDRLEGTLKPRN
ncbi:zinc-dependent metalloprotease [Puia dinghuensis]|uniref:Glutaminyl-tRNA synthetase n=1 Tax=Puia dinghuensis TaxID=1792502 RepID=A0A8J2UDU5_9BACT|nr:zinc-dependent metalloprotease [Puia dinghuensis]GGB02458.1 glutaminyl-tRNA synthetase [Puia dinghuensis]